MLKIQTLRTFVNDVKDTFISDINFSQVITSDKEFVKFLEERKTSENTLLFAVAPDHGLMGQEDRSMYLNYLQFFIIDKSTEKDLKHDAKLDLYDKLQGITKEFIDLILGIKSGEIESNYDCGLFQFFDEETVEIKLFWDGLQCRGYEIIFQMKTKR
ncbi:hypothetical protein [Flavobacterium sp. HNIBRBA15423]|uniref:hypothetical protein n=1 Tax=Flavobacterium sp. HNIBRBA15423 TaxID=3458683 RepID=UPI0040441A94